MKKIKNKKRLLTIIAIFIVSIVVIICVLNLRKEKYPKEIKMPEFDKIAVNNYFSNYLKYIEVLNLTRDEIDLRQAIEYVFYCKTSNNMQSISADIILNTINEVFDMDISSIDFMGVLLEENNLTYNNENYTIQKIDVNKVSTKNFYPKFITSIYQLSKNEYKLNIDVVEISDVEKLTNYYNNGDKTKTLNFSLTYGLDKYLTIYNYKDVTELKDTAEMIIEVNNGRIKIKSYKTL